MAADCEDSDNVPWFSDISPEWRIESFHERVAFSDRRSAYGTARPDAERLLYPQQSHAGKKGN